MFGTDFITSPSKPRAKKSGGEDDGGDGGEDGDGDPLPLPEIVAGERVSITPQGHYIMQRRDGRDVPIPVEEYRQEMMRRVLAEAHTLDDFRGLWVETQKRRQLIDHLLGQQYSPEVVRELTGLRECDNFDLFAHYGYRERALKRREREREYLRIHAPWFDDAGENAAVVLQGLGHQFGASGTEALESELLWQVPEIARAGGLDALRSLGKPADVMREAKTRLFGV